jgi:phosphoribosylaminoimidazole-succinocarboxamide synthase
MKQNKGVIVLIDEIHTPDSSRFIQKDIRKGRIREKSKAIVKEFVRRWLIQNGFQGLEGQQILI